MHTCAFPIAISSSLMAMTLFFGASGCEQNDADQPAATSLTSGSIDRKTALAGEKLISDANCVACHMASPIVVRRLGNAPAPVILGEEGVGSRLSPVAIEERLQAHGEDMGQRMPDLLHGLPTEERAAITSDLVHFLVSQGGPIDSEASETNEVMMVRGEKIYREVGCVACHGPEPDFETLGRSWTRTSLASFLRDPLASHPSGRMPSMHLTPSEANAVATFLLRNQAEGPDGLIIESRPGLAMEFFRGTFSGGGPVEETREADQKLRVDVPGIGPGKGLDNFGVRIRGQLDVPVSGRWSFWLKSDDGSRLYLDGEPIILHDGVHGATEKRGTLELDAGLHEIMVTMFELGGGEELSVSWAGPNLPRQRIPASAFSSSTTVLQPNFPEFTLDQERIQRGADQFKNLGCGACHAPELPRPATLARAMPLMSLEPGEGCLSPDVPPAAPDFQFTQDELADLNAVIGDVQVMDMPLAAEDAVAHTMTRLNCIACHARDEVGGPSESMLASFLSDGDAELGDEGRIPPNLNGVGSKLRLNALRDTLHKGEKVRPYMLARMPAFGADQISDLVVHLATADARPGMETEPEFDEEVVQTGRTLVGTDGVSCIQCHTATGIRSLGVPAVDLADMHRRIRPGWFREHLLDPQKNNPGTRMTAFWGNGGTDRIFPEHLGGDPEAQVDAIYSYLSLGDSMPLPKGIVPDGGQYLLVPSSEPILFGTFMKNVSPRTMAVGFPENAHYAYDMENGRLARCWRGGFMNAEGTWHGRAGQLQQPGGNSILPMPPGNAIEILPNRTAPWPDVSERDAAGRRSNPWHFRGMERDDDRRPIFHTETDGVRIRELIIPRLAPGGTRLTRQFNVATDEGRGDLFMRAAIAPLIEPAAGEGRTRLWRIGDGRTIEVRGADSFLREDPNGIKELIIKIPLILAGRKDAKYEGTFEVEMDW